MNNNMQRTWRQPITVQFQILIHNFLEGWGNKFSGCAGQDFNCEPPEYRLNNEAWFHITKQINILNNCSADDPILINKVITRWLSLACGMLRKQQELLGSFFFSDHKFTPICNRHRRHFLNTRLITSEPRTFTAMNYNSAYSKHFI